MKKSVLLMLMMLCLMPVCLAQSVASVTTLVDSAAYFPQLSDDGRWLLYSNTEGTVLSLMNIETRQVTVVAREGYPGFDARFDANGNVYYITHERRASGLIYRTAHRYDPATGKSRIVLKPQHGQVLIIRAGDHIVVQAEKKVYRSAKITKPYAFTRADRLYVVQGKRTTVSQPAGPCAGYLWAQVSPDGTRVLFEAAGRGLYVCDISGNVIQRLDKCLMPSWYDNTHILAMGNNGNVQRDIQSEIIMLDTNAGSAPMLLTAQEGGIQPAVGPDRQIVYTTKQGTVKLMTLTIP